MLQFLPKTDPDTPLRVLCLGAHSDDIEIGLGASVLSLTGARAVDVTWVVFGASAARRKEAEGSAAAFLASARSRDVRVLDFADSFFPSQHREIKQVFEGFKPVTPDVIFTHARHDLHQDHRVINELTWNTFRDHCILEYEVPKYDADLASPNVFLPVTREQALEKTRLLRKHFLTQGVKHWFDEELFMGLMRIRGAECRSPSGFAEAFYGRKIVLSPG